MRPTAICKVALLVITHYLKETHTPGVVASVALIADKNNELKGYLTEVVVEKKHTPRKTFYVYIHHSNTRHIDVLADNGAIFTSLMCGIEPLKRYNLVSGLILPRKTDVYVHEWDMNPGRGNYIIVRCSDEHALESMHSAKKVGVWGHLGVSTKWAALGFKNPDEAKKAAKSYGFRVLSKVVPYQRGRLFC